MSNLIFKYRRKRINGRILLTPIIKFFMSYEDNIFEGAGVLDSGSDVTIIPKGISKILNLKLGEKEKFYGIGKQPVEARQSKVKITLIDRRGTRYSNIIPILVMTKDYEEDPEIIIGRSGIFNKFDITFKESEGKIIFKPIKKKIFLI